MNEFENSNGNNQWVPGDRTSEPDRCHACRNIHGHYPCKYCGYDTPKDTGAAARLTATLKEIDEEWKRTGNINLLKNM